MVESDLPQIPDDIFVHHILPKCPIKSLLRFKCLNKQLFSTISDPDFKISSQNRDRILLISPGKAFGSGRVYFFVMNNEGHIKRYGTPPTRRRMLGKEMNILGSCKGLILFSVDEEIFLWNPSIIRSCRKVLELDRLRDGDCRVSGFCYDRSEKDYKVVLRLEHLMTTSDGGEFVLSTSLKSKKWKHVSLPSNMDSVCSGPMVNDQLHWVVYSKPYSTIVYFDCSLDMFQLLPMPDPIEEGGDAIVGLMVMDECLCIMRKLTLACTCDIEILTMKEYGVKQSWTRTSIILDVLTCASPFWLRTEFVMLSSKQYGALYYMINGKVYVFHNTSKRFEDFVFLDPIRRYIVSTLLPYVESVLPTKEFGIKESRNKTITFRYLSKVLKSLVVGVRHEVRNIG